MGRRFTILFVDDDENVRESTTDILAEYGQRLLVATNGYEALDLIAQQHVDVLLTDIVMPDINGIELAKRAKAQQPDIKIMFMTAYYSRAAETQPLGKLLFKPVGARQIREELDELLNAS